jgi:hypothetical protein
MLEIDVEMNVFEKELELEKKLDVEMAVFEKKARIRDKARDGLAREKDM